jgi:hypothetical protein
MSDEKKRPPPIQFQSDGKLEFRDNPDGSKTGTSDKPVHMHIETIKAVGVENLVDIEQHTINKLFGSVSHLIKFYGGGEVRFSYNAKGEILEFTGSRVDARIENGERLVLRRQLKAGDKDA